jgi:coenzyme PQQ precursor peptide PqqA
VVLGRARIWPEAERTLAFAHGLGERGEIGHGRGHSHLSSRSRSSSRAGSPLSAACNLLLNVKRKETRMHWTTPTLVEICIGLEINGYLPAEF